MNAALFAVVATLALAAPAAAAPEEDLATTVSAWKDHAILATAIKEAGLTELLKGKGPLTLFAPTDAAFKKLGDEKIKEITTDKAVLKKLLLSHVAEGKVLTAGAEQPGGKTITTLGGATLPMTARDGKVTIGSATLIKKDQPCTNGVIHVIDAVLLPAMR
jgi:uncharacterized surface protein with fasciclin (FAS1) repeats